ncbi:MAG TPA: chemotaxis protein CheX [bacterium]
MRLECVEAFADASVKVLVAMLGDQFGAGPPRLACSEERGSGVIVHVRFSGEAEGHVALEIDSLTALRLYAVATGQLHDRLPPLGLDYFLELGNVISGAAVSRLNELGFDVVVHPPELLDAAAGDDPAEAEACLIPVYSPHGGILVQVVLCTG